MYRANNPKIIISQTQNELVDKNTSGNGHYSQYGLGLGKKKEVNATIEYSINNSGFTNYKPEEIDYYKNKYPENFTEGSPKKNFSNLKPNEAGKPIKLSKVRESMRESESNIKFVDYGGFEGKIKISKDCIMQPRKTYSKRYGKTIIKESTFVDQDKFDMQIKKSVVETVNQNMSIPEDKKQLRGSYVKKHYRKLGGPKKKKPIQKVIKNQVTRNVNIEDLPNVTQMDISFDHEGRSRVKMQQVLDANGNVIEQDDQVLSSVYMTKSQANAYQDMDIQGNLKIVRKLKQDEFKKKPEYQVVDCYTEEKTMKNNGKYILSESFTQTRIAEEYREAILSRFLNQYTERSEINFELLEKQYISQLSLALGDESEFIEMNLDEIMEQINNEIIENYNNPKYKSLSQKPSQATNLTFGKKNSLKGNKSLKIESIVRYATQHDSSSRISEHQYKTNKSFQNKLKSVKDVEKNNEKNQLEIQREKKRQNSMYIRDQLRDAPQIRLQNGTEDIKKRENNDTDRNQETENIEENNYDLVSFQNKNNEDNINTNRTIRNNQEYNIEYNENNQSQRITNVNKETNRDVFDNNFCLLYTSPSPRDGLLSRMPSSA